MNLCVYACISSLPPHEKNSLYMGKKWKNQSRKIQKKGETKQENELLANRVSQILCYLDVWNLFNIKIWIKNTFNKKKWIWRIMYEDDSFSMHLGLFKTFISLYLFIFMSFSFSYSIFKCFLSTLSAFTKKWETFLYS